MEIKFSSVVAFIFIASFVIPEDDGAVVLKKFKPKRAIMMESKVNSNISSAISKHQVKDKMREEALINGNIIRNSTGISIKVKDKVREEALINGKMSIVRNSTGINSTDINIKVKDKVREEALINGKMSVVRNSTGINNEIISRDAMLNSTVVNQILSSSFNLSKNLSAENSTCNKSNSECSDNSKVRNSLTTEISLFSDISEIKEKLSKGLELSSDLFPDPKDPVFDVELVNGSLQETTDLRNEVSLNTYSQQSVSDDLSNLADFGTISDESNDNESLQVVTEVLQDGVEKHLDSENILRNTTLENQTGLESIISAGLDFLAQSEIAKNAAVAMEIFNFSDSLITDHMVDDSMINLVLPASRDQNNIVSETVLNETENEHNLTIIHGNNNSTVETEIALPISDKKNCPAPGICIFWFIARNSCTNDDQCSGSKICCKVRCSKQCIDA